MEISDLHVRVPKIIVDRLKADAKRKRISLRAHIEQTLVASFKGKAK
jgi:hypothetical protein